MAHIPKVASRPLNFPRLVFAGNSSQCIKPPRPGGQTTTVAARCSSLASYCPPSLRDRHSRHLGLLPFVTWAESHALRCITGSDGFQESKLSDSQGIEPAGQPSRAPALVCSRPSVGPGIILSVSGNPPKGGCAAGTSLSACN